MCSAEFKAVSYRIHETQDRETPIETIPLQRPLAYQLISKARPPCINKKIDFEGF